MVMVWLEGGQGEVRGACAPPPPRNTTNHPTWTPTPHPKSPHLDPFPPQTLPLGIGRASPPPPPRRRGTVGDVGPHREHPATARCRQGVEVGCVTRVWLTPKAPQHAASAGEGRA